MAATVAVVRTKFEDVCQEFLLKCRKALKKLRNKAFNYPSDIVLSVKFEAINF